MSPHFVRPYAKSNKNDTRDAQAICEAVARPSMPFVGIKSQARQDVLALDRGAPLLRERTALMNQMRGLLAESGFCSNDRGGRPAPSSRGASGS
jgi:transposase